MTVKLGYGRVTTRRSRMRPVLLVALVVATLAVGYVIATEVMYIGNARAHSRMHGINRCSSNLRQVGYALLLYANAFGGDGRYPPDFSYLVGPDHLSSPEIFFCPADDSRDPSDPALQAAGAAPHLSFVYVAGSQRERELGPTHVVAYERHGDNHAEINDGGNVLFGDGHVRWIVEPAFTALVRDLEAGRNPPRPSPRP